MGGLLDSVFGGGQQSEQDTTVDPTTQALNQLKLQQVQNTFGTTPYSSFAQPGGNQAYTPTASSTNLLDWAKQQGQNVPTDTMPNYNTAFNNSYNPYFNANFNTNFSPQGLQQPNSQLMSMSDYTNLGLNAGQNYINQIASPEIKSALALQGMEGSGALPESIARATAQYALPFVQSIPGVGVANAGVRLGEAQQAQQNAALGMQGTQFGNQAIQMGNQAQQMGNDVLTQGTNALLGQNQALFQQAQLPAQLAQIRAGTSAIPTQIAGGLFSLSDQQRSLREQDLLRQQGAVTTAFTGIPYTPSTSSSGSQSKQPLFNFFGQG